MLSEKRISEIHSFKPKEIHLDNARMSGSSVIYANMAVGDLGSDAAPRTRDQGAELTAGGG